MWTILFVMPLLIVSNLGGVGGMSTTDALVETAHRWYEAMDKLNTYVRVVMPDFSKAFDLINHQILLDKLTTSGLPVHIVRWMGLSFLTGAKRLQYGIIVLALVALMEGYHRVPCWPEMFVIHYLKFVTRMMYL